MLLFFIYICKLGNVEEERTIYNLHVETLSPKDIVPASIKESLIVTQII